MNCNITKNKLVKQMSSASTTAQAVPRKYDLPEEFQHIEFESLEALREFRNKTPSSPNKIFAFPVTCKAEEKIPRWIDFFRIKEQGSLGYVDISWKFPVNVWFPIVFADYTSIICRDGDVVLEALAFGDPEQRQEFRRKHMAEKTVFNFQSPDGTEFTVSAHDLIVV
jgi:hypothetical protein